MHCFLPTIEAEEENGVEDALACDDRGQMAMQARLDTPEPRNRRQAMESPESDGWRKADETEMLRMAENCVYKQVARPKDKLVVRTKMLYKRKIGQNGEVEKYKCRLVAQGFWQVEGVHYTEKYSPTPATSSIRMLLAMAAAKDGELRHFDAEQAFLKADIDEAGFRRRQQARSSEYFLLHPQKWRVLYVPERQPQQGTSSFGLCSDKAC